MLVFIIITITIITSTTTEDWQTSVQENAPSNNDILNVYALELPSITSLSPFFLQCYFHYSIKYRVSFTN